MRPAPWKRRRRWRLLGIRLGTPLLLGVGTLTLALVHGARDRQGDTDGTGKAGIADLGVRSEGVDHLFEQVHFELPHPPGPPDAGASELRDVIDFAPAYQVGANHFPPYPAPLVPKPEAVRGIYLNAWAAGSPKRRAELLSLAGWSEINAFVIDVKEAGEVSYRSGVAIARAIGAGREYIPDPRAMLAELRAAGVYPIARIVVFKDPILVERRPDLAILTRDSTLWRDTRGGLWVDPYNREVWDYNIDLAREAILLGFSEIQWDYVRFPDVPARYYRNALFPAREGRSFSQAIREFLQYSRTELADLGVPITADLFGLTVSAGDDLGIGQRWDELAGLADALLPMIYPSHFARGSYGIPLPNADPYLTVKTALDHAVRRSARVEGAGAIRPWLQDFSLGWPPYGAPEVRAQIEATYDAGLNEWILWNPGSRYSTAALAPAAGPPPRIPLPRHMAPVPPESVQIPPPDPRIIGTPISGRATAPGSGEP